MQHDIIDTKIYLTKQGMFLSKIFKKVWFWLAAVVAISIVSINIMDRDPDMWPETILKSIKKDIDKAEVISFDIFDTLLLRPYVRPSDLFKHMEKTENKPGFYKARRQAEKAARSKKTNGLEDIKYEAIYEEIDEEYKTLKQKEMDFEEMVLRTNFEMKEVYDYALKKGKKIIITSDMYLPTEFLTKVLKKNGYEGFQKIYVSGDIGKTKSKGSLYKHILSDNDIKDPSKILHIGDNHRSDVERAKEHGIKAIHYEQVFKQYSRINPRVSELMKTNGDKIGASIMVSMFAHKWQEQRCGVCEKMTYWERIGYEYAGPLAYGYARFVQQQAKEHNLDTILFVARDGYLLHKVFQDIEPNIKSHYVYAPRRLMSTAFLKYNPNSSKTSSKIIGYCATQDQRIKEAYKQLGENNAYNNHNFIQQHIDIIKPIIQKNHDNYKRYIDSIVTTDKKIGVVDGFSRGYTTQRLLSRFLKNDILGIYYLLAVDPVNGIKTVEFNNRDYDIKPKEYIIPKYLCFFEMILSSPEDPIEYVSVEGKPLYEPNPNMTNN